MARLEDQPSPRALIENAVLSQNAKEHDEKPTAWSRPCAVELQTGMEINSYASAELEVEP